MPSRELEATAQAARLGLFVCRFGDGLREAHQLGCPAGEHDPASADFFAQAGTVIECALPPKYRADLAALLWATSTTLERELPGDKDTTLTTRFARYLASALAPEHQEADHVECSLQIMPSRPPQVLPFADLAIHAAPTASRRLHQGGVRVVRKLAHLRPHCPLSAQQLELLRSLAAGITVIEIGLQAGYCERSMYRRLGEIWRILGVNGREQGISLAIRSGWL